MRGERYPGGGLRTRIRRVMGLRKQLVQRPSSQRSQYCFRNWWEERIMASARARKEGCSPACTELWVEVASSH